MLQDDSSASEVSIDDDQYQEVDLGIANLDAVASYFGVSNTQWFHEFNPAD